MEGQHKEEIYQNKADKGYLNLKTKEKSKMDVNTQNYMAALVGKRWKMWGASLSLGCRQQEMHWSNPLIRNHMSEHTPFC